MSPGKYYKEGKGSQLKTGKTKAIFLKIVADFFIMKNKGNTCIQRVSEEKELTIKLALLAGMKR